MSAIHCERNFAPVSEVCDVLYTREFAVRSSDRIQNALRSGKHLFSFAVENRSRKINVRQTYRLTIV